MARTSIRTRLALWFGAGLVATALTLAGISTLLLVRGMRAELDADLTRDLARVATHMEPRPGGKIHLRGSYRYDGHGDDGNQRFLDIVDSSGRLVHSSSRPQSRKHRPPPLSAGEASRLVSVQLSDGLRLRRLSRAVTVEGRRYTVHLAHSEKHLWATVRSLLIIFSVLVPFTILASGLGGWFLARKALQPIQRMTSLAQKINASSLRTRIPVENPKDELGQLAGVLNDMLERIDEAFENLKRFTSDASHELRTPLASIKALGEVSLKAPSQDGKHRETVVSMLRETNRMTELVEALLLLSRADAGRIELCTETTDLARLAEDTLGIMGVLAEEKGLRLESDLRQVPLTEVDPRLLRQALMNLLQNAITYTPKGGEITVSVRPDASGERILIQVKDTGVGMDLERHQDIFERFYRIDDARTRATGGAGLGLAITRWIARAHGGEISVSSSLGEGSTFTVALPTGPTGRTEG